MNCLPGCGSPEAKSFLYGMGHAPGCPNIARHDAPPQPAPSKFHKKPVVVEAIQFDGHNYPEVVAWIEGYTGHPEMAHSPAGTLSMTIPTLEGDHRADPGDWIIRGVAGEFYPCKPDIFAATYESVQVQPPTGDKLDFRQVLPTIHCAPEICGACREWLLRQHAEEVERAATCDHNWHRANMDWRKQMEAYGYTSVEAVGKIHDAARAAGVAEGERKMARAALLYLNGREWTSEGAQYRYIAWLEARSGEEKKNG